MVPDGLGPALTDVGLHLAGPLGSGGGGTLWSAVDATGTRWAATVATVRTVDHAARLQERGARLATVDHPHLARVGPVLVLPDGRVVVLHEAVVGTDLATVQIGRGRWEPGEVVTVVVPLAAALAALHDAGLAHGDVAPANVILTGDGRAVLVDVVTGADPFDRGTPGYAAPERSRGATPAGDVHGLGRLGRSLLPDDAAADPALVPLVAILAAAVDPDPALRPTARDLAGELYRACPPLPVRPPDPAVLARLTLSGLANQDRTTTQRAHRPARGRHRRRRRLPLVGTAVAVTVAVLLGGTGAHSVLPGTDVAHPDERRPPGTPAVAGLAVPAVTAAVRLTHRRALAVQAADPSALASLTVPHSPAAVADGAHRRARGEARPADLTMVVREAGQRGPSERLPGSSACPEVVLAAEIRPGGEPPGANPVEPVVLVLCPTPAGWRVAEVRSRVSG